MNFDSFFDQVERSNLVINFDRSIKSSQHLPDNEALFQLPLISLIILLMAKDRRKPFVSEIGQMVGESLESSMPGFKGSAQHLGWSANLRIRTVKALTFLEQSNLVEIQNRKGRLEITELGKKVIDKALGRDDDLSYNLAEISRAYRNIRVSKQLDMELGQ